MWCTIVPSLRQIYHLIERASPDEKEDIFKIGKFMIKLSEIKVMEGHMY